MSDSAAPKLNACGCCEAAPSLSRPANPPGLPALSYRLGTYATFLRRLLDRIHSQPIADGPDRGARPLAALTTRSPDDPAVALLDAWAVVADVLTFYQERIANEGYLRTATERRSVLELARAIGFELSPGVAASAYLAFTLEDVIGAPAGPATAQGPRTPGAPTQGAPTFNPGLVTVPRGAKVQSIPAQGKLPQTFETSADLQARVEWNKLLPRMTRPQDLAISSDGKLYLLGVTTGFPSGASVPVPAANLYLLNPLTVLDPSLPQLPAVEVHEIYLAGTNTNLKPGDRLLLVGVNNASLAALPFVVRHIEAEAAANRTRVEFQDNPVIPQFAPATFPAAALTSDPVPFTQSDVSSYVLEKSIAETDLQALIQMNRWDPASLTALVNSPPASTPPPDKGVFAFRAAVGFFGNAAPLYKSLTSPRRHVLRGDPYPDPPGDWDAANGGAGRYIWTDSQGNTYAKADVYLERSLPQILPKSWTVFEGPSASVPSVFWIAGVTERSLADYAISGRATGLELAMPDQSTQVNKSIAFTVRKTSAYVQSEQLALVELPIVDDIHAGATELVLNGLVLGWKAGQPVALTGTRSDASGVAASEILTLHGVVHNGGFTTLVFETGLQYGYLRDTVTLNANVVPATHGETVPVPEVLGGGDASQANQTFVLKKSPLTYVSAPTPSGAQSTLEVRVNDLLWQEAPSLYGLGPRDEDYVVRLGDDAAATLTFGDGVSGARLPAGQNNIVAEYRTGIGVDGNVDPGSLSMLQSRPPGLRGVTNPLPASGGANPQDLASARVSAPLTVLTLDRIVSLEDYENFARAFAGIGKAQAVELWNGAARLVHITVAGGGGAAVDSQSALYKSLVGAIDQARDPVQQVQVSSYQPRSFHLTAGVWIDEPRYQPKDVLAAVQSALQTAFSFDQRAFAQAVTAAEIVAAVQAVPGVIAVELSQLYRSDDAAGPSQTEPAPFLPAAAAQMQDGGILPAELLLLNPIGVTLTEMTP